MQISSNIVNWPKSNDYVLVGIRAIVSPILADPPSTAHVRLYSAIVHFFRNNCLYFVC